MFHTFFFEIQSSIFVVYKILYLCIQSLNFVLFELSQIIHFIIHIRANQNKHETVHKDLKLIFAVFIFLSSYIFFTFEEESIYTPLSLSYISLPFLYIPIFFVIENLYSPVRLSIIIDKHINTHLFEQIQILQKGNTNLNMNCLTLGEALRLICCITYSIFNTGSCYSVENQVPFRLYIYC